jgi:peptidoglycan/xylan/chitin deacetylase (PgdA/CDA1 family)
MFKKLQLVFILSFLVFPFTAIKAVYAENSPSAVVFVYHRIGQDGFTNSNISLETFTEHIKLLKEENFHVLPLADIFNAFDNNTPLPDNTVAITFEGGFAATRDNAIPLMLANNLPFTIFFASDRIDRQAENYMSWADLKRLKQNKLVSFGMLPEGHDHLVKNTIETNRGQINSALSRIQDELAIRPKFFAYPYGEYSMATQDLVSSYDFIGAFGQHSGGINVHSNRLRLPRFSMTEHYAGLDRFKMAARSRALTIKDIMPEDHYIPEESETSPSLRLGFSVENINTETLSQLSCFASEIGKLSLTRIADDRFEADISDMITDGRTRINCTMPSENNTPGEQPRWYWFGLLLTKGTPIDEF